MIDIDECELFDWVAGWVLKINGRIIGRYLIKRL